ncbi:hypothetical protein KSP40_PGU016251 [Platanthera guangdongensis]|uniref:Uncharacterized protein n=1 Tax=Platanthera guangdongensis TaxID=2320717 RepID=A0ABR2MBE7_9ASPA
MRVRLTSACEDRLCTNYQHRKSKTTPLRFVEKVCVLPYHNFRAFARTLVYHAVAVQSKEEDNEAEPYICKHATRRWSGTVGVALFRCRLAGRGHGMHGFCTIRGRWWAA